MTINILRNIILSLNNATNYRQKTIIECPTEIFQEILQDQLKEVERSGLVIVKGGGIVEENIKDIDSIKMSTDIGQIEILINDREFKVYKVNETL